MNVFQFNKVIYKGNINIDFYLYCLKEDIKLIRFLFYNLFYFILSTIFNKYKDLYDKKKYKYLKYVKNLDIKIERFYQKNRYNNYINSNIDMIIDKVAKILIAKNISNKIIAYELDYNYEVKIDKYNKEVSKINKANHLYIRNRRQLININFNKLFIVNNNRLKYVYKREINGENLFIILVLSFILTCISFCYTNYVLYMPMIITYFEPKLFLLNFLPIFLFVLLFYFITKRIHITFLINSLLVIALSIANQTKVLYRDDIVKFEDLTLFKEAIKMIERYSIIIRWYTIIFIVIIILIYFILKKYCKKYSIKLKKQVSIIILTIALISLGYKLLYTDEKLYDSLGDKSLINVYISTRQSQIRGLIYPFIYTINEAIDRKPENYDEKLAKDLLEKYEYEDIDENKKVNIIAIMLEAYNDFSKYGIIKFNEDIYQKLHTIQENSITGNLVTNIFGGNTVVTERNFLTGYTDFPSFRKNTNSYVWYLKEQGYRTEAMHPYLGKFYNRISYDINLGFDNYYNYENKFSNIQDDYMIDNIFFNYIIEGYEKSKDDGLPYFNFSVTYQNHGPYNSENYDCKEYFFDNSGYDISSYNTINEYFSGIKKTNKALEKIINYFDNEEEPTIIIFFGDHNPYLGESGYYDLGINLDISTVLGFENYYETPYVIHANDSAKEIFDKSFIGKGDTISPIFLMNELFDYIGLKGNEYLQYMSNLKNSINAINPYYYRINGEFKLNDDNNLLEEYNCVSYYYSRNYGGNLK